MPDNQRMEKRAGKLMEEFKDLVFPAGYVPGAKKRVSWIYMYVQEAIEQLLKFSIGKAFCACCQ